MTQAITVKMVNLATAISPRPAAKETKERSSGMNRPNSTTGSPRRANQASARSRSLWVKRTYLPTLSTSVRPPKRPML